MTYSFELLIDGIHQASIPFRAQIVEPPEAPPQDNDIEVEDQ